MRIIFVRHGDPDYTHDCLTEKGHIQAAAAAERLKDMGITEIYASTKGRAMETAGYTAEKLGLPINKLEFMREIGWGTENPHLSPYKNGHPWDCADKLYREGFDLTTPAWREHPYFKTGCLLERLEIVENGFSEFLKGFGYRFTEDGRIFCEKECDKTIAIFSHGGAGGAAIAKVLRQEFPYSILFVQMYLASITIIDLCARDGEYVLPHVNLMNDCEHTKETTTRFDN
ncbi:MAG: histidine phosphatase family protein [Oscillospiraceae bacterium]|nr:histidine phosphatase family protein [Oscillospiraceae bacterium]